MRVQHQYASRGGTWDSEGKTGSAVVLRVRGYEEGVLVQAWTHVHRTFYESRADL